jgi:hypothetical protein
MVGLSVGRIELNGRLENLHGLLELAQLVINVAQIIVKGGDLGTAGNGVLEGFDGFFITLAPGEGKSQIVPGLGGIVVDGDDFFKNLDSVVLLSQVGIDKADGGMGFLVVGVDIESFLKFFEGFRGIALLGKLLSGIHQFFLFIVFTAEKSHGFGRLTLLNFG